MTTGPVGLAGYVGPAPQGGGGSQAYADVVDYFDRVDSAGGSFDQTAVNSDYTETRVKSAILTFALACEIDGIWDKLTEAYLLAGVTWDGVLQKLKHVSTAGLTNNNFVTGDYNGAGSSAGLLGNASTKYLGTSVNDNTLSADDKSFGAYQTAAGTNSFGTLIGIRTASQYWGIVAGLTTSDINGIIPSASANIAVSSQNTPGCLIASRRGVNDAELYKDGASIGTDTSTPAATNADGDWELFRRGSSFVILSNARLTFAFLGVGMSDSDSANLSSHINYLMSAIGANAY